MTTYNLARRKTANGAKLAILIATSLIVGACTSESGGTTANPETPTITQAGSSAPDQTTSAQSGSPIEVGARIDQAIGELEADGFSGVVLIDVDGATTTRAMGLADGEPGIANGPDLCVRHRFTHKTVHRSRHSSFTHG